MIQAYLVSDPCTSNPCQNSGQCYNYQTRYTCYCVNGYTGTNCERPPSGKTYPDILGQTVNIHRVVRLTLIYWDKM